jgi:hypothetical protein
LQFSRVDVIGQERRILASRKDGKNRGVVNRIIDVILFPKNPKHTFTFHIPHYLFIRSVSFCYDVAEEIEDRFEPNDLARILYEDFFEYVKKTNNIHDIYKRLNARDLSPTTISAYQTDEAYRGVISEEMRGFEEVQTRLEHKVAIKGEFLLRDMLEIYQDHQFKLENILEIIYCDFVEDYRKGLIKNPINKIVQYL